MRAIIRLGLGLLLVIPLGTGCSGSSEGKPNPDLKVPEIPPGGRGSKNTVTKPPGQK